MDRIISEVGITGRQDLKTHCQTNLQEGTHSYLSAEYTFRGGPIAFRFFYDGGFLRRGDFKFIPGDGLQGWYDNWGLGLRIMSWGWS